MQKLFLLNRAPYPNQNQPCAASLRALRDGSRLQLTFSPFYTLSATPIYAIGTCILIRDYLQNGIQNAM